MNPLVRVLETLTPHERAIWEARSEGITFPEVGRMFGTTESGAWAAFRNAEYKILRAFKPLLFRSLKEGTVTDADIDLGAPRNPAKQKRVVR